MLKQMASVKTRTGATAALDRDERNHAQEEIDTSASDEDPPGPTGEGVPVTSGGIKKHKNKRLNAGYLNEETYQQIKAVFELHGLSMGEGLRIGVQIFAKAVPVLAEGGQLVFRRVDGTEESYTFPFL